MQQYTSQLPVSNVNQSAPMTKSANNDTCPERAQHLHSMYTEGTIVAPPMQTWMSVSQAQQNYRNFTYTAGNNNGNESTTPPLLPTPPTPSSHSSTSNSPVSTNMVAVNSSSSHSAATVSIAMPNQPLTSHILPQNMLHSDYMTSSGAPDTQYLQSQVAVSTQQPNIPSNSTDISQQQQFYSPSPSPPLFKRSSFGSDSSTVSTQQIEEESTTMPMHKRHKSINDIKRDQALERNRQAALRCRQRKKEWLNQLQNSVETLTRENRALEQQSLALREEILNLKTLLLAHRDCSHAHLTNNSIPLDNLIFRTSQSTTAAAQSARLTRKRSPSIQ